MPTISVFYGITIQMFWTDHPPPHFHVVYGEHKASVDLRSLTIADGWVPTRVLSLTLERATLHRTALLENWELCARRQTPKRIPPLE